MKLTPELIEDKLGTGVFWDSNGWKSGQWTDVSELINETNCIVYGDDGGDTFLKRAENSTELKQKLKDHLDGDTGCDFETQIYLIVKDGEVVKVSDFFN